GEQGMVPLTRTRKRLLFVLGDLLAVVAANLLAVMLRFDFDWSNIAAPRHRNLDLLVIDLILTPLVFYSTGLYHGYWKYAGLDDLVRLLRGIAFRTVGLIVVFYGFGFNGLSRAVVIINTVLLMLLTGALRLLPRFHFEFWSSRRRTEGRRALIIGAGDTGEALLRELRKSPQAEFNPVGFVDDDREKTGAKIHGVPVLGVPSDLERLIEECGAREVIIAVPSASGHAMRETFEICRRAGARFRTVPTRGELARGVARVSQIRLVELEDLLGRDVVSLDQGVLRESLSRRRVLITGAAGSIGRELARQVATYEPDLLVLLDRNENNLFYLEAELREAHPLLNLNAVVGDVLDSHRMDSLFGGLRPEIVFHAAAYKHVPLMERNPVEAIKNNVVATRHLAEVAVSNGVDRFVYVSTDKAVRPTSVMGATKRLGERLVKSIAGGATRFIAVRFGNVMGSDGSVIPTFRKQIASGGPVTVTHPEATRYFMTIPEAVQLVLMAGAMGDGGETFLLRMGNPVRIVDLAKNLIELSGLKVEEDIRIVFTGLRPGEKLHEELKSDQEEALPTSNEKITVLTGVRPFEEEEWLLVERLEEAAMKGQIEASLASLQSIVRDYTPQSILPRTLAGPGQKIVGIGVKRRLDAQA
ncbi:MAG TPA: nucleoside-diphosphate sugar epimerase/dehydratase, partial [Candidatus Polarisedimenticolia bacterium]|nr:nucleoside-diphosphate sugar epimerase/dehydratase [Candidatus Polarisedimenticolia bacterium]